MRKTLVAVITTASAAAMICGASLAAAAARPAASTTEHFQGMSTSVTSNKSSVIATGVFTAGGVDISISNTKDTFKFPTGTFTVTHHATHTKQGVNTKTCLFTVSQRGTYKLSNGTGSYAGISGHGKYVASVLAVLGRNSKGKCSMKAAPAAFQQLIKAQGPVKL
jgi:hypothetical protein